MSLATTRSVLFGKQTISPAQQRVTRRKLALPLWGIGLLLIFAALFLFPNQAGVTALPAHDPLSATRDRMFMIASVKIVTPDYHPAASAIVTLDGSQQVIADAKGVATFEHAMHDNHTLTVYHENQHYRLPFHIHSPESGLILGLSDEARTIGTVLILLGLFLWLILGFRIYAPRGYPRFTIKKPRNKPYHSSLSLVTRHSLVLVFCFILITVVVPVFGGREDLVQAAPQYNMALPSPNDLKIEEDDNNAILTWDGGPGNEGNPEGVGGYRISWGIAGQPPGNVALTQYRVIQLQPLVNGQKYEVQVQSVDMQGNLSAPSKTVGFTGTPARVDAIRAKMTGFFDDFNLAAGAANELKWNNAWSYCSDAAYSAMFINNQFHAHNMVSALNCDRGQSLSRPRAVFDFSGRTGTISFDFDGEFRRDQWYLDLVPNLMDITGQVNIESNDGTASNPGNVLRFHQNEQNVEILWIDAKGVETRLVTTDYNSAKPLDEQGLQLVPNVRRHWELKVSQNSAEVWVNGNKIVSTNQLKLPYSKAYVLWNEFSYNTVKSNEPYVLVHWDNFGFDGPASPSETHNYRTAGYGGFDYAELDKESVKREITIPDQLAGAKAQRLMFTLQMYDNWYDWSPNDRVIINGQTLPIPKPTGISADLTQLVSTINPYSMIIDLPPGVLKTGVNELEFAMLSGGLTNVHVELDFPANAAPPYTPPDKVYPLATIPAMPDVGPGAYLDSFGETSVEVGGTVNEDEAKKVYPLSGRVPVRLIAHNEIAMNATGKNPGLAKVELRLNQKPIYTLDLNSAPYFNAVYNFDTTQYANGQYSLDVVAYNKNGTPSIPDYFQGHSRAGDYYPLQISINNSSAGASKLPVVTIPPARGDDPKPTPGPGIPQPKPAAIFGNVPDNSAEADTPAPSPAVVGSNSNPGGAAFSPVSPATVASSAKVDLKALLPLLAGGFGVILSLYLVTGALVGDRLRRKHRANRLGLGLIIIGWPYFALRRPKIPH